MGSSDAWTAPRRPREGAALVTAPLLAVLWVAACGGSRVGEHLPFYSSADLTAEWIEPGSAEAARAHRIDDFDLVDQDGVHVTRSSLAGHVYLANFVFSTCSSVCPRMSATFARVQAAFVDDPRVALVSHTVDPEHDTPERLRAYASRFGAVRGRWHFVRGDRPTVYALARRSYFAEREPGLTRDATQFVHTENVLLVDGDGHVRGVYEGTLLAEAERMITDIRRLEHEMDAR